MHRDYVVWESPILRRPMEMLWHGHAGRPMIWFPTSQGRFYQGEDAGLIAAVADLIEEGAIQVASVDSVDGESFRAVQSHPARRLARHDAYDRYLYEEVVPWVKARAYTERPIATLGCGFGAYHAVNFAWRHPDVVDKAVGLSGQYDIHPLLDGYWDDTAYFHCPTEYVANMGPDWVGTLSRMDIAIVSGELDHAADGSRQLIRVLESKGIPHRGHVWGAPYGHDWPSWKIQIRHYVP
jgi:esterase/lipase superfamily enzyme